MISDTEKMLWARVDKYGKFLLMVPFVKMVAVCNNLSFGKVNKDSDIDLFVVAEKGRLFIVRTFITLIFQLLRVRRHGKKTMGRFCLSFFIDESASDLRSIALKNDYYLAFWISQIVPLIDRNYFEFFLKRNDWIYDFWREDVAIVEHKRLFAENRFFSYVNVCGHFFLKGTFGDYMEGCLKEWQLKRARLKAEMAFSDSGILIFENMLKFHNIDRRALYRDRFVSKYGENSALSKSKFLEII